MDHILTTDNITKRYGGHDAVKSVNINIRQGDIYGLIGRNGAGKTTLLKMISGLAKPTSGGFSIFGRTGRDAELYMSRIGTLIESPGLYPNMTARENMRLKSLAMGVRKKGTEEELLKIVGLENTGRKKVKAFSLGMKQRLGIALALIGEPDIVILDEPINGLDPQGIAEIRDTLFRLNKERNITFIISSHILEELSKIATKYGIINDGMLLREMTREELLAECSERIELRTDDTARACTVLEAMGISKYKVADADTIQIFERLDDGGDITMALAENGVKTVGIAVFPKDEWVTGDIELGDMISVQVQSKLLLILCSIFTALFISGEQKHGYIKNIAGLFPGREKLILSKAVVLAMQVTVMLAVFTVVMVITGFVLWGDRLYMGDVGDFVCMLGVQYLLHLGFSMAVAFLCVLSGSSAFGMTAGIIVCAGLLLPVYGLINNAINSMTSGADFEIARYMPDGCISMAGTDAGSDTMITAVIVGLAFFAVTALLSMMIMRKRDIH